MACVYAYCGFWLLPSLSEMLPIQRTETAKCAMGFALVALKNYWLFFIAPWILLKVGILVRSRPSAGSAPLNGGKRDKLVARAKIS